MRKIHEDGRPRRQLARVINGYTLRPSARAARSKHYTKSSPFPAANVTSAYELTATTCCGSKQLEHDAGDDVHPSNRRYHYRHQHRPPGRHLARHTRPARDNNCSDCRGARDNKRYPRKALLSSPLPPPPSSSASSASSSSSQSSTLLPPHIGGAGGGHSSSSGARCVGKIRPATISSSRPISPALLLIALALAHFSCHSTIITGSLAAPSNQTNSRLGGDGGGAAAAAADSSATMRPDQQPPDGEFWRAKPESLRDLRDARLGDKLNVNMSNVFEVILKKRPYSKYWTAEQKWDDLFRRMMAVQDTVRHMMMKNFLRDIEYYADLTISAQCEKDLKYIQNYAKQSSNFRWLAHMFDSTGKSEPGMLTGMLAHMGHPIQCIKVRAPARPSNDSFDERFFEQQTSQLGERFRGKYCLASIRPVLPEKPRLVSRFSELMNSSLLSNISYTGEPLKSLKMRARQLNVPRSDHSAIDRHHLRLDEVPFESQLYEYLIAQRNFMYTLPRFMGVCYPSSCTRDDIRSSLQKTLDDQHQVVDIEFECEQEEKSAWAWFNTQRLVAYVLLALIVGIVFLVSLARYILLSKMQIKRAKLDPASRMANLLNVLDMFSMDKCAGILFIKTNTASPVVDWSRLENNRSSTIDALRGFLMLVLIYSQMSLLGCLPVPFMWSKWSDAMFPFFRSMVTQLFINVSLWSEAFYTISAYLIALKCFENFRPRATAASAAVGYGSSHSTPTTRMPLPNVIGFALKRYMRLLPPMLAFILLNYVWPRLSNGFVFQDQASRLMKPCDTSGWTNMMLFHNHGQANETCLWPSHVSATFFQLHLFSYPLLALCLACLWLQFNDQFDNEGKLLQRRKMLINLLTVGAFLLIGSIALLAAVYSARQASREQLIVPFLIDYIDYDNYQRVIEWMVMPTYNHVTSYMVGLALAFIVVRRKAQNELRRLETRAWFSGATSDRDASDSSVRSSSSTQELQDELTFKSPGGQKKFHISPGPSSVCASSHQGHEGDGDGDEDEHEHEHESETCEQDASLARNNRSSWAWRLAKSSAASLLLLVSLAASWFWNGLGQPMSAEQTFWYVLLSKLGFCLTFAYLFHEHAATRRNSSNPWMVTRFLVPIGRMSLTVFYVGWLVVWFDLLASLHQWHPSHYFLFEKYNEVIFITLIVAMFVYGAFEGVVKRIQYAGRLERVKQGQAAEQRCAELAASLHQLDISASKSSPPLESKQRQQQQQLALRRQQQLLLVARQRVKPFESFFDAPDKTTIAQQQADAKRRQSIAADKGQATDQAAGEQSGTAADWQQQQQQQLQQQKQQQRARQSMGGDDESRLSTSQSNLSPSDRYKLNAELRANYSFASIGLYENAGATGDLSNLNTAAHDPQASPAMSQRR